MKFWSINNRPASFADSRSAELDVMDVHIILIICQLLLLKSYHIKKAKRPGPEFIKKKSCSTQLSMKFHIFINTEIAQIN